MPVDVAAVQEIMGIYGDEAYVQVSKIDDAIAIRVIKDGETLEVEVHAASLHTALAALDVKDNPTAFIG